MGSCTNTWLTRGREGAYCWHRNDTAVVPAGTGIPRSAEAAAAILATFLNTQLSTQNTTPLALHRNSSAFEVPIRSSSCSCCPTVGPVELA
eukprot:m.103072 g.103072  ORF g.103072 m.103072 type:complete len:91 (-) comp12564_c0_seq2:77-349(-)